MEGESYRGPAGLGMGAAAGFGTPDGYRGACRGSRRGGRHPAGRAPATAFGPPACYPLPTLTNAPNVCGRFGLTRPDQLRLERLGVSLLGPLEPRFNVAPGQEILAVRETGGKREAVPLRWGIHPHWGSQGHAIVNVRSDGGFHQGPFRNALHLRRCLVLCDVFYEWQVVPGRRRKQPWALAMPNRARFALGAVWEPASSGEERPAAAVAILTTEPNALMLPLHDRMPVIVAEERWVDWLDAHTAEPAVQEMTMPWPSEELVAWPISERVNLVAHDDAGILDPVDVRPEELDLF